MLVDKLEQLVHFEIIEPRHLSGNYKKKRKAIIDGDIAYLLVKQEGKFVKTIIDSCLAKQLEQYNWCADDGRYARTRAGNKTHYLHRLITNSPKGKQVDHINGNRLDNRLSNLRLCTNQQNQMSRHVAVSKTGYKGVHKLGNRYCAKIKFNRKNIHLGVYLTIDEAALAYNKAAKELFGEFARPNQIRGVS